VDSNADKEEPILLELPSLPIPSTYQPPACCFDNILVVFNFNSNGYSSNLIPKLKKLYGEVFPNMVFFSSGDKGTFNEDITTKYKDYVQVQYPGLFSYISMAGAIERFPNYEGYLFIQDDLLLNFWNMKSLNFSKIWTHYGWPLTPFQNEVLVAPEEDVEKELPYSALYWVWWPNFWETCKQTWKKLEPKDQEKLRRNYNGSAIFTSMFSDVFYIPRHLAQKFAKLARIFRKEDVHLEITVPTIIYGLLRDENEDILRFGGKSLWSVDRDNWRGFYKEKNNWLHPVKMGNDSVFESIWGQFAEDKARNCPTMCQEKSSTFEAIITQTQEPIGPTIITSSSSFSSSSWILVVALLPVIILASLKLIKKQQQEQQPSLTLRHQRQNIQADL